MEKKLFKEINDIEFGHWWFRGRRKVISNMLRFLVGEKKKTALDIGFGTGLNSKLLGEFSETVSGLDLSEEAILFAKQNNPDLKVFKGEFPLYNFDRSYDIIILLDVLEHIQDDARAIRKIEELLNNGGIALLTVPALQMLWTEHDVLLHHYRRYTKKELQNLILNSSDLIIEKISYFNTFLFFPILSYRFLRKAFGLGKGASDFFMAPTMLNALLSYIFSLESYLLRFANFPIGVSLICVVRRLADKKDA